jgi:hypothetical protein
VPSGLSAGAEWLRRLGDGLHLLIAGQSRLGKSGPGANAGAFFIWESRKKIFAATG